tara:strand:+ start:168 stop:503 length:336 start_codon:yes stop_codon:yes gene_type:complete
MEKRNNILNFNKPKTIQNLKDLFFVDKVEKQNGELTCFLSQDYWLPDRDAVMGGSRYVRGRKLSQVVEQLDDVIMYSGDDYLEYMGVDLIELVKERRSMTWMQRQETKRDF